MLVKVFSKRCFPHRPLLLGFYCTHQRVIYILSCLRTCHFPSYRNNTTGSLRVDSMWYRTDCSVTVFCIAPYACILLYIFI